MTITPIPLERVIQMVFLSRIFNYCVLILFLGVPDSIRTQAEGDTTITSTDNQDDSALSLKDILTNSSSEHKISSEEPTSLSISVENSETSVRLPTLRIPVHLLSSLTDLLGGAKSHPSRAIKVSIVAALLDLEGPEFILVKKGADAGRRVGLLKLVLGDEDGHIATLSVWRELAEEWANQIRKGDILLLQSKLNTVRLDITMEASCRFTFCSSKYWSTYAYCIL